MYNELTDIGSSFFQDKQLEVTAADLTPHYTLTKVASNQIHIYNAATKECKLMDVKTALNAVAQMRGGIELSGENIKAIQSLAAFDSVIVPAGSLKLSITASADKTMSVDPWTIKDVNGSKYFFTNNMSVEATDEKKDEESMFATASTKSNIEITADAKNRHTYFVQAQTRGIIETGLIVQACDSYCMEDKPMQTMDISFDASKPECVNFRINFEGTKEELIAFLQEQFNKQDVFLPNTAYNVSTAGCPCAQCTQPQQAQPTFIVESPEAGPKVTAGSSVETLKTYAQSHYKNWTIKDSGYNVVASSTDSLANNKTFGEQLSETLINNYKTAEQKAVLISNDGTESKVVDEAQGENIDTANIGGKEYKKVDNVDVP